MAGADEVVAAYRDDAGRVAAFRYRLDGETAVLLAASEGGQVTWPVVAGGAFSPAGCPPGSWPCSERRCCQVNLRRAYDCCSQWCQAACTFLGRLACATCLAIACPACLIRACVWWCDCCWQDPPWGP
ncbi:hypothetical protein OO015_11430 [Thermomicrobium sp. 4228-Ro]|uniref:hypothetical protein n=1 Tax=Thermomicrobium sp. 4228-Ro TaxID=2993937 RepID=UPI002248E015|nr:hypothetical protein [Thermomicrobium sp. 4228-Ro]MCX2728101.1 hypothetical protein [Thermomicrobium sp. 4228-Ro]